MSAHVSAKTLARVRDYAVTEPSFTVAFAAWEMGVSISTVHYAIKPLLENGVIEQIEARSGPFAAVYAYVPPKNGNGKRLFPELDEHRIPADLAPARGSEIAHAGRAIGPSGRPGRDRKKQEKGFRVRRQRQGS